MKQAAVLFLLGLSLSALAQDPQTHPCVSRERTEQIYEEYRTRYTNARIERQSFDLMRAFYREANPLIIAKINERKTLSTPEKRALRVAAIQAIRSTVSSKLSCEEETGECREFNPPNSKVYQINYSDNTDMISVSTSVEIQIPVDQRILAPSGIFHPTFNAISRISLRDGRIEDTQEAVEVIHPYNTQVDLPEGLMVWPPLNHRILEGMLKNNITYCAQRERKVAEESASVDNGERGNVDERSSTSSPRPAAGARVNNE